MTERIYTVEHTGRFTDGKITDESIIISVKRERWSGAYSHDNLSIPVEDWEKFKAILENFEPKKIEHESLIS